MHLITPERVAIGGASERTMALPGGQLSAGPGICNCRPVPRLVEAGPPDLQRPCAFEGTRGT